MGLFGQSKRSTTEYRPSNKPSRLTNEQIAEYMQRVEAEQEKLASQKQGFRNT